MKAVCVCQLIINNAGQSTNLRCCRATPPLLDEINEINTIIERIELV